MPAAAPPVLLVHGLGSTVQHTFGPAGWPELLTDTGRVTVGVHLPGHGTDPLDPRSPASAAVLAAAGGGPVDAIGFSAGARAVLVAALRQPRSFRRLALIGAGDALAGLGPATASASAVRPAVVAALAGSGGRPDVTADPVGAMFARMVVNSGNDPAAVAAFATVPPEPLDPEGLGQLDRDVLIVLGEHDFAAPAGRLAASLNNARTVVVHGVDHFGVISHVDCMTRVLRFLG